MKNKMTMELVKLVQYSEDLPYYEAIECIFALTGIHVGLVGARD